jgi:Mn2+/Fe2+ NRAMP family transporter
LEHRPAVNVWRVLILERLRIRFPHGAERPGTSADRGRVLPWPREGEEWPPEGSREETEPPKREFVLKKFAPGLVTGAADVDPALVLTATVAGATFGYSLLWVVLLAVPVLLSVFSASARIGYETHQGLVHLLRVHYGKNIALGCAALMVIINMAMIVGDLMAVTDALSIVLGQNRIFFVALVAFSVWYILIFRDYLKITHALVFLALPLFLYVVAAVMADPSIRQVFIHTFVPRFSTDPAYVSAAIALFGSLLTPYVLVWQTSSRREHARDGGDYHQAEHRMGTLVTTVLCFSIMVVAGTVLRVPMTGQMTTRLAAEAMGPAVGEWGPVLFALGIVGSGMVALPILVASLCYSLSEAMEWKHGLSEHPWDAPRFYVMISALLFIAALLNLLRVNPVTAVYWSQILAGFFALPILFFILILSNDQRIMRTLNTPWQNAFIVLAALVMSIAGLVFVVQKFFR